MFRIKVSPISLVLRWDKCSTLFARVLAWDSIACFYVFSSTATITMEVIIDLRSTNLVSSVWLRQTFPSTCFQKKSQSRKIFPPKLWRGRCREKINGRLKDLWFTVTLNIQPTLYLLSLKDLSTQRTILNFAPRGRLCPPMGEVVSLG
jgi:hypothetical protein